MFFNFFGQNFADGRIWSEKQLALPKVCVSQIFGQKAKKRKLKIYPVCLFHPKQARLFATGIENSSTYLVGTDFLCENGNRLERSRSCVTI